jgi:hypothetical protein
MKTWGSGGIAPPFWTSALLILNQLHLMDFWYFFFSYSGWGETESTWYVGHCWPIVPAPDDDYGAVGGMRIGKGNRSTRRKPAPVPLCPPGIPHDLTWVRTRAAAVGSQRLTAWAMARPSSRTYVGGRGVSCDLESTNTNRAVNLFGLFTLSTAQSSEFYLFIGFLTTLSVSQLCGTDKNSCYEAIKCDMRCSHRWLLRLRYFKAHKMGAVGSYKTLVLIYHTARRHTPEERYLSYVPLFESLSKQ